MEREIWVVVLPSGLADYRSRKNAERGSFVAWMIWGAVWSVAIRKV